MSIKERNEIISQIFILLSKLVECDTATVVHNAEPMIPAMQTETAAVPVEQKEIVSDEPMEMLAIKECTELVKRLTSNTIRKLIARGELECARAGCGTNGKILIPKASIMSLYTKQH